MIIDLPDVKDGEVVGVDLKLKDGSIDSYDPVVEIVLCERNINIDNNHHKYSIYIEDVLSFTVYIRTSIYHEDIDVVEWIDSLPYFYWENTDET